jgi:hypothetical protein
MEQHEWEPLTKAKLIGFVAGVGLFLLLALRSEPGFVFLLDHANLLFHEAGHPLVGLLSSRLEPYGGTVGQLVFPCVLAVAFWRKGQPLGFAAAGIWFFGDRAQTRGWNQLGMLNRSDRSRSPALDQPPV